MSFRLCWCCWIRKGTLLKDLKWFWFSHLFVLLTWLQRQNLNSFGRWGFSITHLHILLIPVCSANILLNLDWSANWGYHRWGVFGFTSRAKDSFFVHFLFVWFYFVQRLKDLSSELSCWRVHFSFRQLATPWNAKLDLKLMAYLWRRQVSRDFRLRPIATGHVTVSLAYPPATASSASELPSSTSS